MNTITAFDELAHNAFFLNLALTFKSMSFIIIIAYNIQSEASDMNDI